MGSAPMAIEIHEPEIEALMHHRLEGGGFQNSGQVISFTR
jgi:hypothetical protein